ncbi:hypothetical protein BO219_06415 [Anoxybacillus kestanbolensis]|uniref:Uncharacterized protein n=1 Tax=Anoxybacillus kestanbolensis TaxID=227476 RepID=A0A1V3FTQ4_9BACL|nr:hypothetical protein [Anoxybacillus kestanbolensis]OOE05015.1 hypothetical protein BO219_06415 [Anoxybacillus kestanbolensis]
MKTIEMQVTAHDLRSTFGDVVDYVVTEAASLVEGWTHYDVIAHDRNIGGVEVWELDLEHRELAGETECVADVYIRFYGMSDDTPDDAIVADAIIEVDSNAQKRVRVKQSFMKLANTDTDFSLAADMFIRWCVEEEFHPESFRLFNERIQEEQIDDTWDFFFGYGDDFEKFASDWVDESEEDDYIRFAKQKTN